MLEEVLGSRLLFVSGKGGVGKSILINGVGKWKDKLGIECTYAIDYLKEALFIMEKCNNK